MHNVLYSMVALSDSVFEGEQHLAAPLLSTLAIHVCTPAGQQQLPLQIPWPAQGTHTPTKLARSGSVQCKRT